jgi:hypothetical protein
VFESRGTQSIQSLSMNRAEVLSVAKSILLAGEPTNSHILDALEVALRSGAIHGRPTEPEFAVGRNPGAEIGDVTD